jgi:hypothetical protein
VDDDSLSLSAACLARDRDVNLNVNSGWGRRAATAQHAPKLAGTRMAQDRTWATGEYGGHPPSCLTQSSMADGEDPAMNTVEAAGLEAT